jgi:Tol biopolymer transport system component
LVQGNIAERSFKAIHEGVECPSLSPDGKRLAFKKSTRPGAWQIAVLDLATLQESSTAEQRLIDDQIEWLDNNHLAYELRLPDSSKAQVWTVAADGSGQPKQLLLEASSPSGV